MDDWFYAQGREKCGPVSTSQLQEFIRTGVVTAGTLVWSKSLTEWTPAINVAQLMGQDAPGQPEVSAGAPASPETAGVSGGGGLPWGDVGSPVSGEAPSPMQVFAQAVEPEQEAGPLPASPPTEDLGTLRFSKKRKKPKHLRFTTKLKNGIVRIAALVIAVGILGGGSYYGAQYMGFFDEPIPARLRYLPDNPDFVFTVNVPRTMAVASSMGADASTIFDATTVTGMSFDPRSIQDVTVAGNVDAKSWVAVATLSDPFDIETMFPGGATQETVRVGGEKIFFSKELSSFGTNLGFVTPSQSVLVAGPVETLKSVMKRRGAPMLARAFEPLLEQSNSKAWMAGAADVESLWRMAREGLPAELSEEQRWMAQSISALSFTFSGTEEYDFELEARCKNPKDAPLIAKRAREAMAEQRQELLAMLHQFGQVVDASTKTPLDGVEIAVEGDSKLVFRQHFDRPMMELGREQLAAAGLTQP